MTVLVLGIGNSIMSDDGIGIRVIQNLVDCYRIPAEVTVLEGGTLGLNLLPDVQGAETLLVVDAIETGGPPGTLMRLEGDELPLCFENRISPHEMGLKDLLTVAALMGDAPKEVVLWGIQPERLDVGEELSPSVAARLSELTGKVVDELRRQGIALTTRSSE